MQKIPGSPGGGENLQHAGDVNNHLIGYSYDAAGNMLNDGTNNYTYNAENRITVGAGVTYTYDAGGRRVKKSSGTNYWYGPGGNILAETDASNNWTNYIFFAGQRLARVIPQPSPNPADIKYYVTDHLHSTAMFVDKSGTVLDDNDFYPWGGVVPSVGTTTSTNHYKFTGKERDNESQLDYFGARYYANVTGRWMSPDWAAAPTTVPYAQFGDPQSLNLYAYVRNSPIIRVDADGHNIAGWNGAYAYKGGGFDEVNDDIEFEIAVTGGAYYERVLTGDGSEVHSGQTSGQPQQQQGQDLNLQQVTGIIQQAQQSKSDPVTTAINIFNNLPNNATVKGDTLRQAIQKTELKLDELTTSLVAGADKITKSGNHVTITSQTETQGKIQGFQMKVGTTVSFDVSAKKGSTGITNIKGVQVSYGVWWNVAHVIPVQQKGHTALEIRVEKGFLHKTVTTDPID